MSPLPGRSVTDTPATGSDAEGSFEAPEADELDFPLLEESVDVLVGVVVSPGGCEESAGSPGVVDGDPPRSEEPEPSEPELEPAPAPESASHGGEYTPGV